MNHYKYKVLRCLAMLGFAFPLRYSFISNVGVLVLFVSIFGLVEDEYFKMSVFTCILGFAMGGQEICDLFDKTSEE